MSTNVADSERVREDSTFSAALAMSITMAVREYGYSSLNYSDMFDDLSNSILFQFSNLSSSDKDELVHFIETAVSLYGSVKKLPSDTIVEDVRAIFGSLVYNMVARKLPRGGMPSYIKFVTNILVSKDYTCILVRLPEAFEFVLRAFILFIEGVRSEGANSIVEAKKLFNELSMSPRFHFS